MSITVTTSVDIMDYEVEVEIEEEEILQALESCDDPTKFFSLDLKASAESVYYHFAGKPAQEIPQCVRDLLWHTIGRTL